MTARLLLPLLLAIVVGFVGCGSPAPTPPPADNVTPEPPDDVRLQPLFDLITKSDGDVIIYELDAQTERFFDEHDDESRWVGFDQPEGAVGMTDRPNATGWTHKRLPASALRKLAHFISGEFVAVEDVDFGKHGFLVEYLDGDRPIARLDFHTGGGAPQALFAMIPGQWPDDDGAVMIRFVGNGCSSWLAIIRAALQ